MARNRPTACYKRRVSETANDPRLGVVLQERYRILSRLAAGGMGVIYRGERVKLQRPVAIKFLNPVLAEKTDAMKRFEREAMTMSRLSHPNCVSVIDIGIHESAPFIVMEFVAGRTLKEVLAESGALPPARAIHIVGQILAALSHAHQHDMVHRDIKPANVMLSAAAGTNDHVMVLDFGLARFQTEALGEGITAGHVLLGTPAYMSPEQCRSAAVGPASDIYSTGVVLFELLTGEKPFTGKTNYHILQGHKTGAIPSARGRASAADRAEISAELEHVVTAALAKTPEQRFATADAFAVALAAVPDAGRPSGPIPTSVEADSPADGRPSESGHTEHLGTQDLLSAEVSSATVLDHGPAPDRTAVAVVGKRRRSWVPWLIAALMLVLVAALALSIDDAPSQSESGDGGSAVSVADGADRADNADGGTAAAPTDKQRTISRVGDIEQLIADKRPTEAIAGIERLLATTHEKNGYLYLLLGNLRFERGQPTKGLAAYRMALTHKPAYRSRALLNRNIIESLARNDLRKTANTLFLRQIKRAGIPYLERAARSHAKSVVRKRASWLLGQLR